MAGQWPNQPPAQEGYSYPSYPEQYPQQQYGPSPQQYQYGPPQTPYQQYGQPQPGSYQQPYHQQAYQQQPYEQQQPYQQQQPYEQQQPPQQQPVQTYQQNLAKPSPQTCYNCGSPEHWAQNCPEPRREIPAGDMARQSTQRPVKKFRPDYVPPVITKYPVPPHVQAMHGTGAGYGGQPYPQSVPQAYQAPYGQPTPLSAQPYGHPHYQQWPENQQQQQQQQPHPVSFQRRNTYLQQPYDGYGPAPYYPPGPQYASPVSAHGPQQDSGFNPSYNTGEQNQGPQFIPYTSASPGVPQSSYEIAQAQAALNNGDMRQNSISQSRSMTQSVTPGIQQPALPPEDTIEEEDVALLDIPDLPTNKGGNGIRLVQYPLPALAEDLEAIGGSLPFPSPSSMGFVKSYYFDKETYESQIRDLDYEQAKLDLKDDPILCFAQKDTATLSFDVLREYHGRKTIGELYSEVTHTEGDPHAGLSGSESSYERLSDHAPPQDTENRLAALGVTGTAKPVRAPARPYPPPKARSSPSSTSPPRQENRRHSSRYLGRVLSPGNRSPRRYDSARYGYRDRSASPRPIRDRDQTPPYQEDRSPYYHRARTPPYENPGNTSSTTRQRDPFDPHDNDLDTVGYVQKPSPTNVKYDQFNPPPPPQSPPPPRRSRSSNHGLSLNDPGIPGQNPYGPSSHDFYSPDFIDGHHQAGTPTKCSPEKGNHRKRNREHRDDSDDERDKERRRQYDDVTPKLKRRQPDVPEAYGRRW